MRDSHRARLALRTRHRAATACRGASRTPIHRRSVHNFSSLGMVPQPRDEAPGVTGRVNTPAWPGGYSSAVTDTAIDAIRRGLVDDVVKDAFNQLRSAF